MLILAKTISETFSSHFNASFLHISYFECCCISAGPMQPTHLKVRLLFQVLACTGDRNDKEFGAMLINQILHNALQWSIAEDSGCPSILCVSLHI